MMTDMEYSRNERSISSWISIGSIEPDGGSGTSVPAPPDPEPPSPAPPLALAIACRYPFDLGVITRAGPDRDPSSDVEETHVLGIALDEVPAQFDVVAHEHRAHFVGHRRLLHGDLQE